MPSTQKVSIHRLAILNTAFTLVIQLIHQWLTVSKFQEDSTMFVKKSKSISLTAPSLNSKEFYVSWFFYKMAFDYIWKNRNASVSNQILTNFCLQVHCSMCIHMDVRLKDENIQVDIKRPRSTNPLDSPNFTKFEMEMTEVVRPLTNIALLVSIPPSLPGTTSASMKA